jgi:predicted dehydrogenase
VEDTAIILLEFASGVIGTVDCLFCTPDECVRNRLEVYGSQGSLLAEGTLGQLQAGTLEWLQAGSSSGGGLQPLPPGNLYRAQIEDFSQAILDSREPVSTGAQGFWIQRLLDACHRSAAEQNTQRLASAT